MVKSNAYGHGTVCATAALAACGCDYFGVATLEEAALVRRTVPEARCAVFGGILPEDAERAVEIGAEVVTSEAAVVEALAARARGTGRALGVHVKVDTGMHRLGLMPSEVAAFVELLDRTAGVRVVGVCSHFACAESVTGEVTRGQLEAMQAVAASLGARRNDLLLHLANSAAILSRPQAHFDMVRPGLMLYGLCPDPSLRDRAELRRVMTLEAPVVRVAEVGVGEGIGYGHTFRTSRPSKIATLRCGYADGYPRALSGKGWAVVRGARAPIVGRVCMDHVMIDVTDVDTVRIGDYAQMWGPANATEEIAALAGTISYELVARVAARVPRVEQDA